MNCSHEECLTEHWVRLMANYQMALEPEKSEMLAFACAIRDGKVTEVECLREFKSESVTAALDRIGAEGRPQQQPEPDASSQDRRYWGFLHPPKP